MWPVLHRGGGGETGNAQEMGRPRSEPSPPRGGGGGAGGRGQASAAQACSGAARAGANRPRKGLGWSDALAIAHATRPTGIFCHFFLLHHLTTSNGTSVFEVTDTSLETLYRHLTTFPRVTPNLNMLILERRPEDGPRGPKNDPPNSNKFPHSQPGTLWLWRRRAQPRCQTGPECGKDSRTPCPKK